MPDPRPERPPADPPALAQARSGTFLGRLTRALQRQDWATVAVEVAIVVLGVVIGFQVNAWGQTRADRATEQRHLRQLAADLEETIRQTTRADRSLHRADRAGDLLWAAFYEPVPPPRDSLLAWRNGMGLMRIARPVLGTTEALIATGDLALIRDDSLRSLVTGYVEEAKYELNLQVEQAGLWRASLGRLEEGIDPIEARAAAVPEGEFEALAPGNLFHPAPDDPRIPFPLDAAAFLSTPDMLQAAWGMKYTKWNLRRSRARLRRDAQYLLKRVEAELDG